MADYGDALTRRYDVLRNRATQQAGQQTQEEQDALKRRFAAMGGLNSGSFIKQQQLSLDRGAQRGQAAREGVDMIEMADRQRLDEAKQARDFAAQEAQKQRDFSSLEGVKQREFATSERVSGQDFQSEQAQKQRDFSKSLADMDAAFKERMFDFDKSKWGQQLDLELKKFGLEEEVTRKNLEIQEQLMNQQTIFDRMGAGGTAVFGKASNLFNGVWSPTGPLGGVARDVGNVIGI